MKVKSLILNVASAKHGHLTSMIHSPLLIHMCYMDPIDCGVLMATTENKWLSKCSGHLYCIMGYQC